MRAIPYLIKLSLSALLVPFFAVGESLDTTQIAAQALARALKPYVKTTAKPVAVYSYFRTPSKYGLTTEQVTAGSETELYRSDILQKTDEFWQALATLTKRPFTLEDNGNTSAGIDGFYAALDPVTSVQYGGRKENWALFEIGLQSGFRYLELGSTRAKLGSQYLEIPFDSAVHKLIKEAGCEESSSALLFISPPSQGCAHVVGATLKILKIDAILYPFSADVRELCPQEPFAAFLFVGKKALGQASVKAFNQMSAGPKEDLSRLIGLLRNADPDAAYLVIAKSHEWYEVSPDDVAKSAAWAKKNLFACDPNSREAIEKDRFVPAPHLDY
jgi:hypothetical protein